MTRMPAALSGKVWAFVAAGLLVALLLAGLVSTGASRSPDGLESTARRGCTTNEAGEITGGTCMARSEREHEVDGPLADYGVRGIDNPSVSTGLAGLTGVLLTFAIGGGLFWLARRRGTGAGREAEPGAGTQARTEAGLGAGPEAGARE